MASASKRGFTLIEIATVLIITGLILGLVLVGRTLINAALVKKEIAQIQTFQHATDLFRRKYGYLPGDIKDPDATDFGFQPRGALAGEGDGDGILAGNCSNNPGLMNHFDIGCGEPAVFWEDLGDAHLLNRGIQGYNRKGQGYPWTSGWSSDITPDTRPNIAAWIPPAAIGLDTYVYVYSVAGRNYFAVSSVLQIGYTIESTIDPGITVLQASMIDRKIDDGLPQSGAVNACYVNYDVISYAAVYAAGSQQVGASDGDALHGHDIHGADFCTPTIAKTPVADTDCFDNNNTTGVQTYALAHNATRPNCALSFQFEAGE